jgi:hypothetical protein
VLVVVVVVVVYADHGFALTAEGLEVLLAIESDGVVMRCAPALKGIVWQEFSGALGQPRYTERKHETRRRIGSWRAARTRPQCDCAAPDSSATISRSAACATFSAIATTGNPECQTLWAIVAQPYRDIVTRDSFRRHSDEVALSAARQRGRWRAVVPTSVVLVVSLFFFVFVCRV